MEVQSSLAQLRRQRGISAAWLAAAVGISRQTIYAIESGSYVPNTSVALKLARVLEVGVEQLFRLEEDARMPLCTEEVEVVSEEGNVQSGQALQLCRVGDRLIGVSSKPSIWGLPRADAVVVGPTRYLKRVEKTKAEILEQDWKRDARLLIAGCDPGAAVLAQHLQPRGVELVITYQNSSRALELLKNGAIHIAGTHLLDEKTGEFNLPRISRMFSKDSVAVVAFALWEEGIVVASGNPKNVRSAADFVRPGLKIVNREPGAGCRLLLDSLLRRLGIASKDVKGYDRIALGHLPAARQVQSGNADCCISTRAAARVFGLDFIPLVTKRYDLVVRKTHLKLPPVEILFETLGRSALRRELEGFAGYDMKLAGDRLV
jgi:molybdate-binding protein/DNA-binding XRE family transcriptional regulator